MTPKQLANLTETLLDVSRRYLAEVRPESEPNSYICHMTTSMVLAGIAEALLHFQSREDEDS
jgi:hypothetical protein